MGGPDPALRQTVKQGSGLFGSPRRQRAGKAAARAAALRGGSVSSTGRDSTAERLEDSAVLSPGDGRTRTCLQREGGRCLGDDKMGQALVRKQEVGFPPCSAPTGTLCVPEPATCPL